MRLHISWGWIMRATTGFLHFSLVLGAVQSFGSGWLEETLKIIFFQHPCRGQGHRKSALPVQSSVTIQPSKIQIWGHLWKFWFNPCSKISSKVISRCYRALKIECWRRSQRIFQIFSKASLGNLCPCFDILLWSQSGFSSPVNPH